MSEETVYLTPEAKARVAIDRMLASAGWEVQSASKVNLTASRGVAVREFVLKKPPRTAAAVRSALTEEA